jgi:hypothetical protein
MKKRLVTALLVLAAGLLVGTQAACTPTRSLADNSRRQRRLFNREALMLVEDINHFLLLEHPTRLNNWHYKQ